MQHIFSDNQNSTPKSEVLFLPIIDLNSINFDFLSLKMGNSFYIRMIHELTMDMSIKLGHTYAVSYACNLLLTISSQATSHSVGQSNRYLRQQI